MTKISSCILLLYSIITTTRAEREYDEVLFTSEKCEQLGHGGDFDVCAIIESCTSTSSNNNGGGGGDAYDSYDSMEDYYQEEEWEDYSYDNGGGYGDGAFSNGMDDGDYWHNDILDDGHFASEVSRASSSSSSNNNNNNARYGWRIEGSQECLYPGPILRLFRGSNHGLFVRGTDDLTTNIHFHGLHVKGTGNGDDPRRSVQGSDNYLIYGLDLPHDKHHGGTYWYHSHLSTKSWSQVKGGSFGMIVIDENGHDVGTNDSNVLEFLNNEKILVLDNSQQRTNTFVANGMTAAGGGETFEFVKDEWYRMRILAVNVDSYTCQERIRFDGSSCTVHALAHDGIFRFQVPKVEANSEYLMTSSSRLDVAIQCSRDSKIHVNDRVVATIKTDSSTPPSEGSPFESGGNSSWQSARLEYTKDLRSQTTVVNHWWEIKVYETNINNVFHAPLCDDMGNNFMYGSVQEWELRGVDTHPLHLHVHPMQITNDGCGTGHDLGEYYDTIVTAGSTSTSSSRHHCQVRVHLVDIVGPAYMHCHIFEHAEQGSSGWITVTDMDKDKDNAAADESFKGEVEQPDCKGVCGEIEERDVCHSMDHGHRLRKR